MSLVKEKVRLVDLVMITLGAGLYTLGFVKVNMENNLAEGGLAGIALLIHFWTSIDPAYSTLAINIPLLIIGYKYLGGRTLFYTIFGTLVLSAWIWFWQRIPFQINIHHDLFIAGILAGLIGGFGSGLVYRFGGTTGGSDIIARIFEKKQGIAMGKTLFGVDIIVLLLSLSYIDIRLMMYTLLASYVFSQIVNFTLEGAYTARGIIIISNNHEQIAENIMERLHRGVTFLNISGGYSKKQGRAIYCIVSPNELTAVKRIAMNLDKKAFISVFEVSEVAGEGFTYLVRKKGFLRVKK